MWSVYYAPGVIGVVWNEQGQYQEVTSTQEKLIPVLAMNNPTHLQSHSRKIARRSVFNYEI